jgi:hypothetical protein
VQREPSEQVRPVQHTWPLRPQRQVGPPGAFELQSEPSLHVPPEQHGSLLWPQVVHRPFAQIPAPQVDPSQHGCPI